MARTHFPRHGADALAVELEEQQRGEQRQHGGVGDLDDAGDQPALLAVHHAQATPHHEEVLGVGGHEDGDRRQDGTDDHDEQQGQDVLRVPQRLVAVVERAADPEVDVAFLRVGLPFLVAALLLVAGGRGQHHDDHRRRHGRGDERLPREEGAAGQHVDHGYRDQREQRQPDDDDPRPRPPDRQVVHAQAELVALAQGHEVRLERLEPGAAHDALGQGREHELAGALVAHHDPLAGPVLQEVGVGGVDLEARRDAGRGVTGDRRLCR